MSLNEIMTKYSIENEEFKSELNNYIGTLSDKGDSVPITRFKEVIKQKNEAIERVTNLEVEIENFKKIDVDSLKATNEQLSNELNSFKTMVFEKERESFKPVFDLFNTQEGDVNYEKFKKIKEGSFENFPDKIEDLTPELLKSYTPVIKALENAGAFNIQNQTNITNTARSGQISQNITRIVDPFLQTQIDLSK